MKLEDAKHLKEEAHDIIHQQLILPYSSGENAIDLGCQVALGVHPTGKSNYKLAIHVPERWYLHWPVIEEIIAQACGEVDIEITGAVYPCDNIYTHDSHFSPKKRVRPLSIGVSISHEGRASISAAGTLGCFVRKKQNSSDLFFLSNNHVLALKNKAQINDSIIQPAEKDGGVLPEDSIASLQDFISLKHKDSNTVDAAIAKIENADVSDPSKLQISLKKLNISRLKGVYNSANIEEIEDQLRVIKIGRTTGITWGEITAFELERVIPYEPHLICPFQELIAIKGLEEQPFSDRGDSGSLIFDEQGYGLALLCAGTPSGMTYANPIHHVLNFLDVELAIS